MAEPLASQNNKDGRAEVAEPWPCPGRASSGLASFLGASREGMERRRVCRQGGGPGVGLARMRESSFDLGEVKGSGKFPRGLIRDAVRDLDSQQPAGRSCAVPGRARVDAAGTAQHGAPGPGQAKDLPLWPVGKYTSQESKMFLERCGFRIAHEGAFSGSSSHGENAHTRGGTRRHPAKGSASGGRRLGQ